jgi:excinuclease ABC subunit A
VQQTPEQILKSVSELPEGTKAMILAPLVRGRRGKHQDVAQKIRKAGFVRVRVDGQVHDIEQFPELAPRKIHDIEAVIDRVVIRKGIVARISESIDLALQYGEGTMILCYLSQSPTDAGVASRTGNRTGKRSAPMADGSSWQDRLFSAHYACPQCGVSYEELQPRTFSFNSPYGACSVCDGLGVRIEFDPELLIPDPGLSLAEGAVLPWKGLSDSAQRRLKSELQPFFSRKRFAWETPLATMTPAMREFFLRGDKQQENKKPFVGILNLLERELATTSSQRRQQQLAPFRDKVLCPDCDGARLRVEARSVRLGGRAIHEITSLTISEAVDFFESLVFEPAYEIIAKPIVTEILNRLQFLQQVGVDYLSLDRAADSLSSGELQRVRLATSIGSGLIGVCYILDEPSIGLHPRDNQRLIDSLRDLQQLGNSVLVVEHDEAMMRASDHIIDMGPAAGEHGGSIVAAGTPSTICKNGASLTGRYLSHAVAIPTPQKRRKVKKSCVVELLGAETNNLKGVDVRFPIGTFTCVTGVSGSGKSSLVNETFARGVTRRLGGGGPKPGPHRGLRGTGQIEKLILIDQSPIGRSPRSNPATYTGIFDEVRKIFADTKAARERGFSASRFSFNIKGGR